MSKADRATHEALRGTTWVPVVVLDEPHVEHAVTEERWRVHPLALRVRFDPERAAEDAAGIAALVAGRVAAAVAAERARCVETINTVLGRAHAFSPDEPDSWLRSVREALAEVMEARVMAERARCVAECERAAKDEMERGEAAYDDRERHVYAAASLRSLASALAGKDGPK